MGVFETLAALCTPEDLAEIREAMREFLSSAGAGPKVNRGRLSMIAERLFPLERRYLPDLNAGVVASVPCESLVCYVKPGSRLALLVAAVLSPRRVFVIETPGSDASIGVLVSQLERQGTAVIPLPRGRESGTRAWDRVFERLRREDALDGLVFFPGEGPSNDAMALTAYAQRRGNTVVWAESETYAGVERPFSVRVYKFGTATAPRSTKAPSHAQVQAVSTVSTAANDGWRVDSSRPAPAEPRDRPAPAKERDRPASERDRPAPAAERDRPAPAAERVPAPTLVDGDEPAAPPRSDGDLGPTDVSDAGPLATGGSPLGAVLAELLVQSFNGRNYPAALRLCWHVAQIPGALELLWVPSDLLDELVRVYSDWDRMIHSPVEDTPERRLHDRLVSVWQRLGPARGRIVKDRALSRNAAFLRSLQTTWRPGGRIIGEPSRVVDFLRAGMRSRARGQFSHAASYFLRSMELAAMLVLDSDRFELGDPLEPSYQGLTELVGNYGELADRATKALRAWGLNESMSAREAPIPGLPTLMALLEGAGESMREGPALAIGSRFRELMTRTRSGEDSLAVILRQSVGLAATSPLDAEGCERAEKAAREIASRAVGVDTFRQLMAAATHPTLLLPGDD